MWFDSVQETKEENSKHVINRYEYYTFSNNGKHFLTEGLYEKKVCLKYSVVWQLEILEKWDEMHI